MAQALKIRMLREKNNFRRIFFRFKKDAEALPKREARFTRVRARSIMKKGPRKPKTRYGERAVYKRGKKKGQSFYRKGLYSAPGHPPLWHTDGFNLRSMKYVQKKGTPDIPYARGGNRTIWIVGPLNRGNYRPPGYSVPIPALHEHGGTVMVKNVPKEYMNRWTAGGKLVLRRTTTNGRLIYPERPYMQPASVEARTSSARKSPNSEKAILKLGGLKGKKLY